MSSPIAIHVLATESSIKLRFEDGTRVTLTQEDADFDAVWDLIEDEEEISLDLLTDPFSETMVQLEAKTSPEMPQSFFIRSQSLWYKDADGNVEPVEDDLFLVIKRLLAEGDDPIGLYRFYELLRENPSKHARQQLFRFLMANGIFIDNDGYIVGFRAVRSDYKDHYSGTTDATPGNVVEIPRQDCDLDPLNACSAGLHLGSWKYVNWYKKPGSRIVAARTSPTDVVSVPTDSHHQEGEDEWNQAVYSKLRTCRYESLRDVTDFEPTQYKAQVQA